MMVISELKFGVKLVYKYGMRWNIIPCEGFTSKHIHVRLLCHAREQSGVVIVSVKAQKREGT
jgi:hypothetical protein